MSPNDPIDGRALSQIGSSSASQVCVARELYTLHEPQNVKKKCQTIPEKIKKCAAVRAWKYGIPADQKWASKVYPDHILAGETVTD